MAIEIRKLRKKDHRANFDCGNDDLNLFFRRYAGQNQFRHHIGTTYIALDGNDLCGFFSVSLGNIELEDFPMDRRGNFPAYPLPILRLSRFAVDQRHRGRGLGKLLLKEILKLSLELKDVAGCIGILVDAKPEAVAFYQRYAFLELGRPAEGQLRQYPEPIPMFLSIKKIARALAP